MRGEFDQCRELLDATPSGSPAEATRTEILRAELARAEGDVEAWYAAAKRAVRGTDAGPSHLHAIALQAAAARHAGKDREATKLFESVEELLPEQRPNAVGAAVYLLALDAWESGDYDRAEQWINRNLTAHAFEAESLALCAWIEVKRERYTRAGAYFSSALDSLAATGNASEYVRATIVDGALAVASEIIDLPLGHRLRREYESMQWKPALWRPHFTAATALWRLSLLEGDLEGAWATARDATSIAKTPAYKALAEMNAAELSRMIGDATGSLLQLRRAWQILRGEQWSAADVEARVALTGFAIEGAQRMPAEARKAITTYQSLSGKSGANAAAEKDRRVTAFEALAAARVSEATGNIDRAIGFYERSLKLWTELEYRLRASIVALDLRRLTGDDSYLDTVDDALKRAPKAWFRYEAEADDSPLGQLTNAERGVLLELLQGKSTREIARESDRSEYTISNHTRKIFAAFEVHSRSRLLARCVELGITEETIERGTRPIAPVLFARKR